MPHDSLPKTISNSFNREKCLKIDATVPTLPLLAIRGRLCFRCFQPAERLMRCTGCNRSYYCSKECQKRDWEVAHKGLCKYLKKINEIEARESAKWRSWEKYRDSLYDKTMYIGRLKNDQSLFEIVQGQAYCSSCHRSAANLANAKPPMTLKLCEQCELVSACGECTLQHSPKVCKQYQEMNRIDLFRIAHFELTGKASIYLPTTKPRTSYKPLSSAANWADYYLNISDRCITLGPFLQRVLRQDLASEEVEGVPEGATPEEIHAVRQFNLSLKLATDTLSRPLSIIAALEDIGLVSKEKITLHVIGAAGKEMAEMVLMEELLHLLPSLNHLDILYIGPNTPALNSPFEYKTIDMDCCPTCKSCNRRRSVTLYRALYHDFAQSPHYRKPDLAVLFHSGRSQAEEASWAPTTRYLVDSATMTLCTTYTLREAMEEYAELHQLGAKFLVEPEANHWRSLLPLPEFLEGTEHGVFYQNYFRYIFRGIRLDS